MIPEKIVIVKRKKTSFVIEQSRIQTTLSIEDSEGGHVFVISKQLFDLIKKELSHRSIS